jgi:hypothetical protein
MMDVLTGDDGTAVWPSSSQVIFESSDRFHVAAYSAGMGDINCRRIYAIYYSSAVCLRASIKGLMFSVAR